MHTSAMTKPALFLSNGREDRVGSSLKPVAIAVSEQNPANESGVIAASEPPAIITSACDSCCGYHALQSTQCRYSLCAHQGGCD
jgi:hypothetical protein